MYTPNSKKRSYSEEIKKQAIKFVYGGKQRTSCIASSKEKNRIYLITLVSRDNRQIVGYDVAYDKGWERIQKLVDKAPKAYSYYSDAYSAYSEVCYEGRHISLNNKSQTYTVEGVISDLRHYIKALHRRSKCFLDLLKLWKLFLKSSLMLLDLVWKIGMNCAKSTK